MTNRAIIIGGLAAATLVAGLGTAAAATSRHSNDGYGVTYVAGSLGTLNGSGAAGAARVKLQGHTATVTVYARGVVAKLPHAMHIHAGGMGTCPTAAADVNGDRIVSTTEGHHAYGGIAASLTVKGDTSPASALTVARYSTAPRGVISYRRTIHVDATVARQIRKGNAVIVVHGIDRNRNGMYDFGAGKSDLDPKLPLEATSPAACGALRVQNGR
jgi:hypothetical protein